MPEVKNCKRCGKLFNSFKNEKICKVCEAKDEEDFKLVKDFLYYNPGATITEVVRALDMSIEKIKGYLREERIEIVNREGNCFLECERCGVGIPTGRLCRECSDEMAVEFKNTADEVEFKIARDNSKDEVKMRHLK